MPNGTVAPGKVLPPAPPPTGLGELLSSVPMNGLTYWVRLRAALAGPAWATRTAPTSAAAKLPASVRNAARRRGIEGSPLLLHTGPRRSGEGGRLAYRPAVD